MAKRIYFAFHYDDVASFRANGVRNHNAILGADRAGYYDASIWEESKKQGEIALKRLINRELCNTSVTAVLIGSLTYSRRWVRYEIMKSIERGNALLGIHINGIPDKAQATKANGPNPFSNLGLQLTDDGEKIRPTEWTGTGWDWYKDMDPFIKPGWAGEMQVGVHYPLSTIWRVYDWITDNGFVNFRVWVA